MQARPWRLALASLVAMCGPADAGVRAAPEHERRRQRPARHEHAAGLRPARAGLRRGLQRPAAARCRAAQGRPAQRGAAGAGGASRRRRTCVAAIASRGSRRPGTSRCWRCIPRSAPQAAATTDLVNRLRHDVLPPIAHSTGLTVLVGGFTAGSIDFSHVLSGKLPLFIALVVILSALLLLVMFRSIVIAVQAAVMNLLSIGGALGVTVPVFQWGWLGSLLGVEKGPIEPWIPVLMFAVVFGLSMDYEVFLVSRVREEWVRRRDASDGRRRRHRVHRTRDQRGRRDHDLRVPLVHARQRADAQGVRLRPRRGRVPRRARRALRDAARGPRAARPDSHGGCRAGSTRGCRTSTSRGRARGPGRRRSQGPGTRSSESRRRCSHPPAWPTWPRGPGPSAGSPRQPRLGSRRPGRADRLAASRSARGPRPRTPSRLRAGPRRRLPAGPTPGARAG